MMNSAVTFKIQMNTSAVSGLLLSFKIKQSRFDQSFVLIRYHIQKHTKYIGNNEITLSKKTALGKLPSFDTWRSENRGANDAQEALQIPASQYIICTHPSLQQ